MKPADFSATIERLGLSQVGAAAFLGVTDRAVRHWIAGDREIPAPVERFLLFLLAASISTDTVRERLGLQSCVKKEDHASRFRTLSG